MAAASLDYDAMADVLRRWGYVNPDKILFKAIDSTSHVWRDKANHRSIVYTGAQHGVRWFVMYVD